jgi:hypothetical protein
MQRSGPDRGGCFSQSPSEADGCVVSETFHVVPIEDWLGHEEVQDRCVCGPHVEFFPRGTVVVHHALDGRHAADPGWPRRRAVEVARDEALGWDLVS